MAAPVLLICVGAAKAGTSWLYRALHDREECALPVVKELHYWDTFEAEARDKQLAAFRARLVQFAESRAAAEAAGRGWQVRNMDRRMADMRDLMATLEADRVGDAGYRAYLEARAGKAALTADMTPGYALLDEARLTRVVALSPMVRILYLIRDPLARLWSHVRMQAERQREAHQSFDKKAQGILRRIVKKGHETHLTARGDYAATIARLRRVVPPAQLMVAFMEEMVTAKGYAAICRFLGLPEAALPAEVIHEGPKAEMAEDMRAPALELLRDQYEWVARNVAPLPPAWAANYARVSA